MGAKSDHFCLFSAYFGVFSPDLWMEYRIFISIVDISANLENIDIDKAILKISISIRLFWKISISIGLFWKISITIRRFWKISISISIRRFRKISISIKYRIDKNLAYRTGLLVLHMYSHIFVGELQTSMLWSIGDALQFNVYDFVIFFASSKYFVEVVITCFYVQKRNEHDITVWIYNKR